MVRMMCYSSKDFSYDTILIILFNEAFMEKVRRGEAKLPSSGFGGRGLERIEKERELVKKSQKKVRHLAFSFLGVWK